MNNSYFTESSRLLKKSGLLVILLFLAVLLTGGCGDEQKFDPRVVGINGKALVTFERLSAGMNSSDPEFSILFSDMKMGEENNRFTFKGTYNGFVAALIPEFSGRDAGIVFRNGAVFSAGDNELKELNLVTEGKTGFEVITAAKIGGRLLAVAREKGKNWAVYNFSDSRWERLDRELPIFEFNDFAVAELAEYQGEMLLFWRAMVDRKIEPVLRMARYADKKWNMLPQLPAESELISGFAVAVSGDAVMLVQDPAGSPDHGNGGMPLYEYYPDKGWRALADIPFPARNMALTGYGIDIKKIDRGYVVARADELGIEVLYSTDIEDGIWSRIPVENTGGSSSGSYDSLDLWNYFLMVLSLLLLVVFIRQNRKRKALARIRQEGGELSAEELSFEKMVKAVRLSRIGGFASLFDRGVALIIDGTLVSPLPFYYLDSGSNDFVYSVMSGGELGVFFLWLGGLSVYSLVAEAVFGQTVGKALLRIRVRNLSGGRAGFFQILARNTARFIDFFPVPLGGARIWYLIAFVSATVSRRKQRIGDMLGRTVVRRHTPVTKRRIILASASPRRKELLAEYGLNFEVMVSAVSENVEAGVLPRDAAKILAVRKTEAIARNCEEGELVIGADTIVAIGDIMLGKPEDPLQAREMLTSLSGRKHEVITGLCVFDTATGQLLSGYELTEVDFRELSENEISDYIASGEGEDKAGSYAVQGEGGDFVKRIYGSTTNVIGLPLELLGKMLEDLDA